jgi:hypothetical protein
MAEILSCSGLIVQCLQFHSYRQITTSLRMQYHDLLLPELSSSEKMIPSVGKVMEYDIQGSGGPNIEVKWPGDRALQEDIKDLNTTYIEARKFLTQSREYQGLLGRICATVALTRDNRAVMETIRREIIKGLATQDDEVHQDLTTHEAVFTLAWSPLTFLKDQQYHRGESQDIGECITITGAGVDAQATTCAQYMRQTWPITGEETLEAMKITIADRDVSQHKCNALFLL